METRLVAVNHNLAEHTLITTSTVVSLSSQHTKSLQLRQSQVSDVLAINALASL